MKHQFTQSTMATIFTVVLFSVSQSPVHAAPGTLNNVPLFLAPQPAPNIFFMLDDSGSMHWSMPADGVGSSALIELNEYDTIPDDDKEWRQWCLGANLMAYNPSITYKPWAANRPGTSTPFPDMTDLQNVWVNPLVSGSIIDHKDGENNIVRGGDNEIIDLSAAPVVTWSDNGNGQYDAGECPGGDATTGYLDTRVQRADSLTAAQQINFANWFSYYRIREHATKAAVTRVAATTSARMGMATLHHNNGVGRPVLDMTVPANKTAFLDDVVNFNSSGGTPLRTSLDNVGRYFDASSGTPGGLNIGAVSSPILPAVQGGECQQNFAMLMTDGQWNGGNPSVGDQDQTVDNVYVYPAHQDNPPNTLGDIAMKWYKTDLDTSLAGKVATQSSSDLTLNLDENDQQHLVTFGVAFGPSGTLNAAPVNRNLTFAWPTPSSNAITTVDDLRHAAYNGRGQFLSASNPETLISALQNVISDIDSRQGSAAAASFNSTSLSSDSVLFFATFDTDNWHGNLESFSINPSNGHLSASPLWGGGAADKLDVRTDADMINNRVVYTWGSDSGGGDNGALFNWQTSNPQPASDILNDLKINPDVTIDVMPFSDSQDRLNFVRGDTANEGVGLVRDRTSRLADIIHSSPFYVGPAQSNWPDTLPFGDGLYSTYQLGATSLLRTPVVYVGANDGMLHGFRNIDGEEVFAYLPSSPASTVNNEGIHYLTESDYGHRYYVDGSPMAADVYIKTEIAGSQSWRTVLIGGLKGGGQGFYALDVTDPSQFLSSQAAAASTVLWEFTNQDDADLGFTFSEPQITMMNNGKWAMIVGNGYNAPGTDKAKLMIVFIEEGVDGIWTLGSDYLKIDTTVGTPINKNGLSTPALVDLDGNGTTDRVYAGDLLGNMWAFDVNDSATVNWNIANSAPLFSAGVTKPITIQPLVVKPDWIVDQPTNAPNQMIYFGTGQYIATGDGANTDQQSFYGIWDSGSVVSSSNLVTQTISLSLGNRALSVNSVDYTGADRGWFMNLPETGERVVVKSFTLQDIVYFNTSTPSSTACSAGGNSWLMAADLSTGGLPAVAPFDTNNDGFADASDIIIAGTQVAGVVSSTSVIGRFSYTSTSSGGSGGGSGNPGCPPGLYCGFVPGGTTGPIGPGKRQSWIQLLN